MIWTKNDAKEQEKTTVEKNNTISSATKVSTQIPTKIIVNTKKNTPTRTAIPFKKPEIGEMVDIQSGVYMMGATKDQIDWHVRLCNQFDNCNAVDYEDMYPQHEVFVDTFSIDIHEVTNAQYRNCVNEKICSNPNQISIEAYLPKDYFTNQKFDNYPVVGVDWKSANTYCDWVGKRLPTEAEWEKAAKGGNNAIFPWDDYKMKLNVREIFNGIAKANYCDKNCLLDSSWKDSYNSDNWGGPAPVMSYQSNSFGIYDLSGNVQEWTLDYYSSDFYDGSEWNNPKNNVYDDWIVTRGGGWNNGLYHMTTVYRRAGDQYKAKAFLGFRCVQGN